MSRCQVNYVVDLAAAHDATPEVLNPVVGCSPSGPGCRFCWAAELVNRFRRHPELIRTGSRGPVFTGVLRLNEIAIDQVGRWKRRRVVFLNDLGDLFHQRVPIPFTAKAILAVAQASDHLFILPTHRPAVAFATLAAIARNWPTAARPPRNLLILISVETPAESRRKLTAARLLTEIGFRVGLSYEPALAAGAAEGWTFAEWVILGSLSGGGDAALAPEAFDVLARGARDFCAAHGIPFYLKQGPAESGRGVAHNPRLDGRMHRELWQPEGGA